MTYSNTWNAAYESSPANNDNVSEGAGKIRDTRTDIRERVALDHYFDIAGTDAEHGEHKQITLHAPISTPTNQSNKGFIYGKDVSGKIELHYLDEDGSEVRLTYGGYLFMQNRLILDADFDTYLVYASDDDIKLYIGGVEKVRFTTAAPLQCDTVDELGASGNGVTVDGMLIQDGKLGDADCVVTTNITDGNVTTAKIADNGVTPAKIDQDTAVMLIGDDTEYSKLDIAYLDVFSSYFVVPAHPNILRLTARVKYTSGGGNFRLNINAAAPAGTAITSTSYATQNCTVDISGLTPGTMYTIKVQLNGNDGASLGYMQGWSISVE